MLNSLRQVHLQLHKGSDWTAEPEGPAGLHLRAGQEDPGQGGVRAARPWRNTRHQVGPASSGIKGYISVP
jgi:hypothetical protein